MEVGEAMLAACAMLMLDVVCGVRQHTDLLLNGCRLVAARLPLHRGWAASRYSTVRYGAVLCLV